MNNKKILVAVTPDTLDGAMFNFLSENLNGKNLHISLCKIFPDKYADQTKEALDQFLSKCKDRGIPIVQKDFLVDALLKLKSEMAFSDVMIIQKTALKTIGVKADFNTNACSMIVLPDGFEHVSNIVLSLDGTRKSLFAIKQFVQIYSDKLKDLSMTLLDIARPNKSELRVEEESMLIAYLKHYNSNLGVLKVPHPMSKTSLKPVLFDSETLVVGQPQFLLSQRGEKTAFKPFYDLCSAVFMPALYK